jgi:hypothetical protein
MTPDPYAILGIAAGASMAEVKRAYRRMAKAFHPDSAGDAAIPKFLAIHEAYEAIVAGRPMQPQTAASWRRASASWAADPARARATRSNRTSSAGGARTTGSRRSGAGPAGSGASGRRPAPPSDGGGRRRSTRKATLGSTSYDDAVQEPFEPEWEGASWYGRASGTYWTINPKEYADPRKHGPEYQERARRAARTAGAASAPPQPEPAESASETWSEGWNDPETTIDSEPETTRRREREDLRRRERFDAAGAARAHAAAAAAGRARMDAADATHRDRSPSPDSPSVGAAIEAWIRALFAARDVRTRLMLAAIGWPPLGVIAATLISNLTGCASFSAACEPPDDLLPLAAGAALYALLVAAPALARLSAAGTIATLLTAVPVAAFAVRSDLPSGEQVRDAGLALVILLLAWLLGMIGVLVVSRGRILRA